MVVSDMVNQASATLLDAVVHEAAAKKHSVTLVPMDPHDDAGSREILDQMLSLSVDGLIVQMEFPLGSEDPLTLAADLPIVFINSSEAIGPHGVVDGDQRDGTRKITEHLIGLGHTDIAHIAGPQSSSAAQARSAAWAETMIDAGLRATRIAHGDWTAESGRAATDMLLLRSEPPTTIMASNDEMAIGAISALEERGLRVPHDVSVTGFDDALDPLLCRPAITTIRQDFRAIAKRAVNLLVEMISQRESTNLHQTVTTTLVVRDSTAPALK